MFVVIKIIIQVFCPNIIFYKVLKSQKKLSTLTQTPSKYQCHIYL